LVNATTEGVVRLPSEFSSTDGSPPSMTAMQEFVVPKSMPSIFAIKSIKLGWGFEFVIAIVAFDVVPGTTLQGGKADSYGVNTPPMVSTHRRAECLSP
jgi:hypothetical protein